MNPFERTVTGNEAQFNEKVLFLKDIEVAGKIISESLDVDINFDDLVVKNLTVNNQSNLNRLKITGVTESTGVSTFFNNVDFLDSRLNIGVGGNVLTGINSGTYSGRVGIGTTQPDSLFQVGNDCLTIHVDPCRVGVGTTSPSTLFQVGIETSKSLNVTHSGRVGIGTTQPRTSFEQTGNNTSFNIISGIGTDTFRVGIGTSQPDAIPLASGILNVDDNAEGTLRLGIDGSIAISRNIYDSSGSPGANNYWLRRDELGIKWVALTPGFDEGIFIQDEGQFLPTDENHNTVGTAQSFTTINFVQRNSLGLGTDTLRPTAADTSTIGGSGLSTIFTNDLWGFNGSGANASIYRMTKVGVNNNNPQFDLDVNGTLNVNDATTLNSTLDVDSDTTLNSTLDVDGGTTLNSTLDVDGATTLNSTLDVDLETTLNSTLDVDGKATFNNDADATSSNSSSSVQIDGGVGIVKKLFVGGDTKIEKDTEATASDAVAALQVVGGAAIGKKLFVGGQTKIEANTPSTDKDTGALVVESGGLGVEENVNVGGIVKIGSNQSSTTKDTGALVVESGGVGIEENLNVGQNTKLEGTLELESSLLDINNDNGFSDVVGVCKTDYRLASVGTGVSWRPSGVQTKRTIWVSKNGCDTNSGLLEGDAKATIGGAAAIAEETDTIKVRPGIYIENNPIGLRTDVSVTGEDIRLVIIQAQNPNKDIFHVRRGCLVENLNFGGTNVGVDHTNSACVAFPPPAGADSAVSGYTEPGPATEGPSGRWRSPYVRNCTNFMTSSIGMKIDGDNATASTIGGDLKSMVCDSFTQYNENGIGVSLTNDAYAQLVSIFTINCDIGIYADTGAQCDLTNSNSSFGNFGLVAVGLGSTQFTGIVSNTNPAGDFITSTNAGEQDTVVCADVLDDEGNPRRAFDGQALFFKIDLDNYPDVAESGILQEPLKQLESVKFIEGADLTGFSAINPPSVLILDADGTQQPKGPQSIIAEATATVDATGTLTSIDVIAQGRNYLPTQNIVVSVEGNTGIATAVMAPIFFTVESATDVVGVGQEKVGLSTITFNEFIPYELFPGDQFSLQRISRILTSSHSFEYVGTGTDINRSTPLQGAIPIKANEIVASDGAQIPFTSTDQKGNFDIGEGIQIDQTTSTIRGRDFSRAIQAEVTPLILALR
jgi:hypothetical protein